MSKKSLHKTQIRLASIAATVLCLGTSLAAQTGTDPVYLAGAERVHVGGLMRETAQRMAVASCFLDAGIEVDTYSAQITDGVADYDSYLVALTEGDPALGIDLAEENRKLTSTIYSVTSQWERFRDAAVGRLNGEGPSDGTDYVSRHNLNMMHTSKYLLREIIAVYAIPPALLQSDAFTLDVVTRQPAIANQISKEACGLITGNTVMGSRSRFDKSVARYEASLSALINGFESLGVSPPPNDEVKSALQAIAADWDSLKGDLAQVGTVTDHALALQIDQQFAAINAKFDAVIPAYIEDSKSGL
ncbi:type IV pili methyl-accepting chemotaxis transducer N-terminal domain-containing protein [Loktanella sp. S4079]|uniref:type IV pili methyl-accepting chemotaxis transducer N-terminal domain-containing protein n=1 Tax=Loktanella sp. S4079 TaxID=579483 RepID=UPI00138E54B0|nr:type IV pili methyl-accepting chemotaxis transducer N-terminal domain-containing protein [Loktanella sp. S4079]